MYFLFYFVIVSSLLFSTLTSLLCDCQPAPDRFHLCSPPLCTYITCLPWSCASSSCSVMSSITSRLLKSKIPLIRLLCVSDPHVEPSICRTVYPPSERVYFVLCISSLRAFFVVVVVQYLFFPGLWVVHLSLLFLSQGLKHKHKVIPQYSRRDKSRSTFLWKYIVTIQGAKTDNC